MKTNYKLRSFLSILLILSLSIIACEEDTVDPCHSTIASAKDIFVTARAQVLDENNVGIAGEQVTLKFEMHACNGDILTHATYTEETDSTGTIGPYTQKITLFNTEDEAFITASAPNLQSTKRFANKTYHYNDFDDDDNVNYILTIKVQ